MICVSFIRLPVKPTPTAPVRTSCAPDSHWMVFPALGPGPLTRLVAKQTSSSRLRGHSGPTRHSTIERELLGTRLSSGCLSRDRFSRQPTHSKSEVAERTSHPRTTNEHATSSMRSIVINSRRTLGRASWLPASRVTNWPPGCNSRCLKCRT